MRSLDAKPLGPVCSSTCLLPQKQDAHDGLSILQSGNDKTDRWATFLGLTPKPLVQTSRKFLKRPLVSTGLET